MKRIFAALALALLALLPCTYAAPDAQTAGAESALMQLEADGLKAFLKGDAAFFERFLAPGYVFVAPDGTLQDKAKWMADFKAGAVKMESSTNDEMKVQVHGDTAIVVYRSTDKGTYKGVDISGQYRWTDAFLKRDGRWQLIATQGTPIPPKK